MRWIIPLQLELDSDHEPPEAELVTATYCQLCFAVIPGHRIADHKRAMHADHDRARDDSSR